MYRITAIYNNQETIIHDVSPDTKNRLSAGVLTEEVGQIPTFSFSLPVSNPYFSEELHDRKTVFRMENLITNEIEFEGTLLYHEKNMDSSGKLQKSGVCEGFLGYLCDSIQPYHNYQDYTPSLFLRAVLDVHNAQTSEEKRIFLGSCNVTDDNTNSKTTAYRNTFEEIKENLINRLGGEISIRRNADNELVLDYLNQNGKKCDTTVELAKNMKSLDVKTDSTNIITRLVPLGCQLNAGETSERLTIETVNDGKIYIDDENAVEQFGIIMGTAVFDDITMPQNLKNRGLECLQDNNRIRKAYSAQVLDLSFIKKDHENLKCGNIYRFKNSLLGIDEDLRLMKRTVDIYKPFVPTVEIGDKSEKITDISTRTNQLIEYEIPKQKSDILTAARDIATSLITNATTGYVVIRPNEILIMDTDDIETATTVWRWNSGGLGYSANGYHGNYGLAMTMNGQIVADFIAAGTMYADRIKGGTLTVGGSETGAGGDGVIRVLDANENEICRLDKNGASIFGTLYTRDSNGYWIRVANGCISGGYGSSEYCTIDATAHETNEHTGVTYNGTRITSDAVRIDCEMLSVNGNIGTSGTLQFVRSITANENGSISWDTNWIDFHNGLITTGLN
jgi:phage minor structural protein